MTTYRDWMVGSNYYGSTGSELAATFLEQPPLMNVWVSYNEHGRPILTELGEEQLEKILEVHESNEESTLDELDDLLKKLFN